MKVMKLQTRQERRWAIAAPICGQLRLLGKACWPSGMFDDMPIFASRREAREAKQRLRPSHRKTARVVAVIATIEAR